MQLRPLFLQESSDAAFRRRHACVLTDICRPRLRAIRRAAGDATRLHLLLGHRHGGKVWASPVFEYEYVPANAGRFSRTQDIATEFHAFVGSMGGAGDKACQVANGDQAELEALRNDARATLLALHGHRACTNGWIPTPKPESGHPRRTRRRHQYFYCYASDMDPDKRATVAALVFEMSVARDPWPSIRRRNLAGIARDVAAPTIGRGAAVMLFQDAARKPKALHDYRKLFSGFNLRFTDVTWRRAGTRSNASGRRYSSYSRGYLGGSPQGPAQLRESYPRHPDRKSPPRPGARHGHARGAGGRDTEGSAAEAAGIKPMDVVLGVNQQAVEITLNCLRDQQPAAGTPVTLRLWRDRAEHDVQVALWGQPAALTAQPGSAGAASMDTAATVTAAPIMKAKRYVTSSGNSSPSLVVRGKVWRTAT